MPWRKTVAMAPATRRRIGCGSSGAHIAIRRQNASRLYVIRHAKVPEGFSYKGSSAELFKVQLRLVADGLADGDDGISPLVNRLADLPFQCVFTEPRALLSGKSNRCML